MPRVKRLLSSVDVEPRDYQIRIAEKALTMLTKPFVDPLGRPRDPVDSVLIESPTGSGKTVMGLTVAKYLQQRFGYRVGWVAMRRNLLRQAERENREREFQVDLRPISMFDSNPPDVDVLVVDEAQHDGARSMASMHGTVRPKKVLGLTATPFRTDRIKLCFQQIIRDIGIQQLIQAGYLSPYRHFTIPAWSPSAVAECFANEQKRWGKSLVFFHRLQQCQACAAELAQRGITAEVVTAKSNREQQIEDFRAGKIKVLLSMAILAEGFDCPQLKTVFCRPSGRGCTIQMCGRVFRRHTRLPFKQIVQSRCTRYPITKTADAAEQHIWIDNAWRSLQLNEEMASLSHSMLHLIAQCEAKLPAVVALHRTQRRTSYHRRIGS